MITARRLQRGFADGFIAEAVEDLWEPWMRHADKALEDDALLLLIQRELAKRCKKSKTRGRKATPAEVVLGMLLLKHVRDRSYETLSREVRANLVYREFTRIGGEKVPDARTMGNLARKMGPELIEKLHRRVVEIAQENQIAPLVRCGWIRPWWRPTSIIVCSAKAGVFSGSQPRQGKSQSPVAWMVGRRETESPKSIDKAVLGTGSESSGRNESERTGGPENVNPRGRALGSGAKAAWRVATG
jgi:hypothetical protein